MPGTVAELQDRYPDWSVTADPALRVVCAERVTGTSLRYVVAHDVAGLAGKLAAIESEEAAAWVASDAGPDYKRGE
jgi:hypothetical protein